MNLPFIPLPALAAVRFVVCERQLKPTASQPAYRTEAQERIVETSLVRNGGLLKHGDSGPMGRRSCCRGAVRGGGLYTTGLGK